MPNFREKPCQVCGELYTPTGRRSKYCPSCAIEEKKARQREGQFRYRERLGRPVHVGKGGSNKKFTDHPSYLNGLGNFHRLRRKMRMEITYCELCGKDLTDAGRFEWCVHHIDHDRTHNVRENLMMLCKRCHQIHHGGIDNLPQFKITGKCNDYPQGVGSRRDPNRTAPAQQAG